MISFPSQLSANYRMRTTEYAQPKDFGELFQDMGRQFLNSASNRVLGGVLAWATGRSSSGAFPDVSRIPYDVRRYPELIVDKPLADIGPSNVMLTDITNTPTRYWYENSLVANPSIYSLMNTYRYTFNAGQNVFLDARKFDENGNVTEVAGSEWANGTLSPSLFNPYYGIQRIGATKNTPLIDTVISNANAGSFSTDFTDCSISTLCKLSTDNSSELGVAKYKYADFMYCKDLGMPNNRMITLRRFSGPVGDMIFGSAATSNSGTYSTPGDIGRLVGYFDTDDNKLEDILNYSFHASWEERTAEIQQLESQEDSRRSPLGMLLNTMSTQYKESFNDSLATGNNLLDWLIPNYGGMGNEKWYNPGDVLRNYDKNKVYEPVDTVRKTHLYTGSLEFNHEFTLTFNYTLRSYDNINPKSAMLDLLANATAVCYKRGRFWGGRQQILGAQPNVAGWQKANKIIDKGWDELGGIFQSLRDNGLDIKGMFGQMANYFQNTINTITEAGKAALANGNNSGTSDNTKKATNEGEGAAAAVGSALGTIGSNMLGMAKGKLQNYLGRPQMYLFNSLLTGDNVGLWHVTIGNPRNPIAVMGNLIVTDAKIQQYGPLGQDDFPTGLKVIVTLKHARPRDMVDIQKMYTRGIMSIYQNVNPEASGAGGLMYAGENSTEKIKRNVDEIA